MTRGARTITCEEDINSPSPCTWGMAVLPVNGVGGVARQTMSTSAPASLLRLSLGYTFEFGPDLANSSRKDEPRRNVASVPERINRRLGRTVLRQLLLGLGYVDSFLLKTLVWSQA